MIGMQAWTGSGWLQGLALVLLGGVVLHDSGIWLTARGAVRRGLAVLRLAAALAAMVALLAL